MTKLQIIEKENITDSCGNKGTFYILERLPCIWRVLLKNGSFRPEYVGKSTVQSAIGGVIEDTYEILEKVKDEVTKGNIYEVMKEMRDKKFNKIVFPN